MRVGRRLFSIVMSITILMGLCLSCTSSTPNPAAVLWGVWAYTGGEWGNLDYTYDLHFQEDGSLTLLRQMQDPISYAIVGPGQLKLTSRDISEVLIYSLEANTLTLHFASGSNTYTRAPETRPIAQGEPIDPAGTRMSTEQALTPAPIVDQVTTITNPPTLILPSETVPPKTSTQTVSVADLLPSLTPTLLMPTTEPTSFITPTPERYFPIANCAASQLHLGDSAFVDYDGGRNSLRDTPDTHPSDNIVGYIYPGEVVEIIDGPVCNYGWVLWKVLTTRYEEAWTPETDGKAFWIVPLTTRQLCPDTLPSRLVIRGEAFVMEEYDIANFIRQSHSLSAEIITRIQPGGQMMILEGPVCNDASNWWKILGVNTNISGWTRENDAGRYFLAPIP